MIIVKTKQGCQLLNDKHLISVRHDKEKQTVSYYGKDTSDIVSEVESVTYVSNTQAVEYEYKGSEVEHLKTKLEAEQNSSSMWRNVANVYRSFLLQLDFDLVPTDTATDSDFGKIRDALEKTWQSVGQIMEKYTIKISQK